MRIERLKELGNQLRRPEADYLRDGIYDCASVSRASTIASCTSSPAGPWRCFRTVWSKEREVPSREIELAIRRKSRFEADPEAHTYGEA